MFDIFLMNKMSKHSSIRADDHCGSAHMCANVLLFSSEVDKQKKLVRAPAI